MSTPNASGRSALSSVHLAAADTLAALMAQGEPWPPASPLRFRNVLLDACGSDNRPLVELLLRVGRHGIVDALHALGTVPALEWPTRRTTLVSRACGELFIGAEMAAWAVDAWAVALGVVPRSAAQALQVEYAASASRAQHRTDVAMLPKARMARAGLVGGQTNTRVRAGQSGAAAIMASPARRVAMPAPNMTPYYRVLAAAAVVMLGAVLWQGLSTPEAPALAALIAPVASNAPVSAPSAGAVSATPVAGVNDVNGVAGVNGVNGVNGVAELSTGTASPQGDSPATLDTTGVPLPLGATPGPSSAWPAPGASRSSIHEMSSGFTGNIRKAGVGGTYVVQQRIVSVGGNWLCDPLTNALSRRVRQSDEQITHEPDSAQFALASRPGVHGVIDADGVFFTAPYRGTHDNIRFVFQMSGRFTGAGFVARTVTQTDAVIKYRQQQQCVVVADLTGSRAASAGVP